MSAAEIAIESQAVSREYADPGEVFAIMEEYFGGMLAGSIGTASQDRDTADGARSAQSAIRAIDALADAQRKLKANVNREFTTEQLFLKIREC